MSINNFMNNFFNDENKINNKEINYTDEQNCLNVLIY